MAGAVPDVAGHDLVEADTGTDFVFCHGRAAEHVTGLHAVNDSVVGLFIPESAEEDETISPRVEGFKARAEFHGRAVAFCPPVLRVKPHPREGDEGPSGGDACGLIGGGSCGLHAIEQREREGCSEATQRVSSADKPLVSLNVHGEGGGLSCDLKNCVVRLSGCRGRGGC